MTAKMVRGPLVHHLSCLANVDSTGSDTVAVPLETGLSDKLDEDHAPETNGALRISGGLGPPFREPLMAPSSDASAPKDPVIPRD